jgi:hypothetical protein
VVGNGDHVSRVFCRQGLCVCFYTVQGYRFVAHRGQAGVSVQLLFGQGVQQAHSFGHF